MKKTRVHLAVAGFAAVAMVVAACGSSGGGSGSKSGKLTASAPGITATTITIGSTQPLTGPAAPGYSEIAPASNAYFKYVNAHGGIFGRKIVYKFLDDGYNPANTTSLTHQLVLKDNIFADFNALGTPTNLAVTPFLNQEKVPQVFVATGCACFGDGAKYPQTYSWQINYIREGKLLGHYIEQKFPGKKVGFFFQNDEFGLDGVKGLKDEIPAKNIVSQQSYVPTDIKIGPAVAKLKAAKPDIVVAFAIPAFLALLKLNMVGLKFSPTLVASDVGTDPLTLSGLLATFAKSKAAAALTEGIITDAYLAPLSDMSNSWIKLLTTVHSAYDAKTPLDGNVEYGVAVAYSFVQAMLKAGKNPTRQDLLNAINSGIPQGFSLAPYAYTTTVHDGGTGAEIGVIKKNAFVKLGPVLTTDNSASGGFQAAPAPAPAPASGIPAP